MLAALVLSRLGLSLRCGLAGVSAWGAIARNEPSKRSEIVHDIWYMPDAEGGTSLRWAALRIGHMKLLQGSGANDWVRPKPDPRAIAVGKNGYSYRLVSQAA